MKTLTWQDVGELPSDEEMQADRDRHMAEVRSRLLKYAKNYSQYPSGSWEQRRAQEIVDVMLGGSGCLDPHCFGIISKGKH